MISFRLSNFRIRAGAVVFLVAAALLYPVGGFNAQLASAAPLSAVPAVSVTVPAGDSASLLVQGFALEPGSALPQSVLALAQQPIPSERLRTTLYYGVDWGYAQTHPQQVALALWYAQNGAWSSEDRAIAERIAGAAASSPDRPAWNADGTSIVSLVAQGKLRLSDLSLTPATLSPASGNGTLTLRNTSAQSVTVYLPYGTLFTSASGSAIVWATGQGQPPAEPTSAPAPTDTPQPQPSPTTQTSYKPGYTPPANTPVSSTKGGEANPTTVPATQAPSNDPPVTEPVTNEDTTTSTPPEEDAPSAPQQNTNSGSAENSNTEANAPAQLPQASVSEPPANPSANGQAAAPAGPPVPITTPASQSGSGSAAPPVPPLPVSTSQPGVAQVTPPKAELTQAATIPAGGKEPTSTPTTPTKTEPTPAIKPPEPAPTPEPTKIPVPPDPLGGTTDPIITGVPDVNQGQPQPLITPNTSPVTGGGPSEAPVWLALFSAIMVLGGWSLRRMANVPPEPVKASSQQSQ